MAVVQQKRKYFFSFSYNFHVLQSNEDGDDDSLNFDADPQFAHLPPLSTDKMRKVRRDIVKTINDFRAGFGRPRVYVDPFTNQAAFEYANFLLRERAWDNPDEDTLEQVCQHHKLVVKQKAIVGYSHLDDDSAGGDYTKMAENMDAHGLLLEMQAEMEALSDPKVTHVGIGFAEDSTKVLVVELLSHNPIAVTSLQPAEDGSIHCEGINLDQAGAGLYAARIVSSTNDKKVASLIGPPNI